MQRGNAKTLGPLRKQQYNTFTDTKLTTKSEPAAAKTETKTETTRTRYTQAREQCVRTAICTGDAIECRRALLEMVEHGENVNMCCGAKTVDTLMNKTAYTDNNTKQQMFRAMCDAGVDVQQPSAVRAAVHSVNVWGLQMLMDAGADVCSIDDAGDTYLDILFRNPTHDFDFPKPGIRQRSTEMACMLLRAGTRCNDYAMLHHAIDHGDQVLFDCVCDCVCDFKGFKTSLMGSCRGHTVLSFAQWKRQNLLNSLRSLNQGHPQEHEQKQTEWIAPSERQLHHLDDADAQVHTTNITSTWCMRTWSRSEVQAWTKKRTNMLRNDWQRIRDQLQVCEYMISRLQVCEYMISRLQDMQQDV